MEIYFPVAGNGDSVENPYKLVGTTTDKKMSHPIATGSHYKSYRMFCVVKIGGVGCGSKSLEGLQVCQEWPQVVFTYRPDLK